MAGKKKSRKFLMLALFLWVIPVFALPQTSPDEFLGFKVGTDRKLADYNQITAYFQKLEKETPKVRVFNIGQTTLKKTMIMPVITSEENMQKLEAYKGIVKRLREEAGTLSPEQARKMAQEGKAILLFMCNIHATEIASSQMIMEFAYKLVKGDTPFDASKVLNDVIIIFFPSCNPDGQQMVVEWYKKYLGTKYEGGPMPWIYHPYAGHDTNRDWFWCNLIETKNMTKVMFNEWLPQVHLDFHQTGSTGERLFIPPYMDPSIPRVDPLVWSAINLVGGAMLYDLQKNGFRGVVQSRDYTSWYTGATDDVAWVRQMVGTMTETASVKVATPIYVEPTEIPQAFTDKRLDFIDPWPGGWWRLRDLVDYQLTHALSLVKTTYLYKEDFLFNFYKMSKNAIEKTEKEQPYAFVFPATQHDYPEMLWTVDLMLFQGLQVHQAKADFVADGKIYPAGSFVIMLAQPYKPFAWALLEKQRPTFKIDENAGVTLPLQMGVTCDQVEHPFEAKLERIQKVPYPAVGGSAESSNYVVLDCRANAAYAVAFALLKDKAEVYRSKAKVSVKGLEAAPGSFIVKNTPQVQKALPSLLEKWHISAYALDNAASVQKNSLKNPRIGIYQSWRANMDEGWTRYICDDYGIPYTTLHNNDFKGTGKEKVNLKASLDVIVFPDENADVIKTGRPASASAFARGSGASFVPPEYEGGIEKDGVDALKAFVEAGGLVVTMNSACDLAFMDLGVPARNSLERVDKTKFLCPNSILKINVDNETPIGYGMPKESAAMFFRSLAMETSIPQGDWDRRVVATFPDHDVLLSGWLEGEEYLTHRAAVVDTQCQKGRIILIGIRCQNRGESHGTYKFLLNSLLYPEIQ